MMCGSRDSEVQAVGRRYMVSRLRRHSAAASATACIAPSSRIEIAPRLLPSSAMAAALRTLMRIHPGIPDARPFTGVGLHPCAVLMR